MLKITFIRYAQNNLHLKLTYTNITIEPYGEIKVDEGVPEKERETGHSLFF
jgi:hypothetical protein